MTTIWIRGWFGPVEIPVLLPGLRSTVPGRQRVRPAPPLAWWLGAGSVQSLHSSAGVLLDLKQKSSKGKVCGVFA